MELLRVARERRDALAERWADLILATYPESTAAFLRRETDAFRNPVGTTIRRSVRVLTEGLLGEGSVRELAEPLDAIVRIRAVQSFSPAEAAGFVFLFRRALFEAAPGVLGERPAQELLELDARLDELALLAWEIHASCREKVSAIRAREATARTYALLKRAGLVEEALESGGGPKECPLAERGHQP